MIKFDKWLKIKGKREQKGHNEGRPGLFVKKGTDGVLPAITIIQICITATVPPILNLSTIWR